MNIRQLQKLFAVLSWCGALEMTRQAEDRFGAFTYATASYVVLQFELIYPLEERIEDMKQFQANNMDLYT